MQYPHIIESVECPALSILTIHCRFQIIYTVRAPVTEDGRPNTAGVADGLNSFGDEVSTQIPNLSISPVMRFGNVVAYTLLKIDDFYYYCSRWVFT